MIVLMPHCGFLSETSRMIAIAQALRSRGEEVVLATHGGAYTDLIAEAGLTWVPLSPTNDAKRQEQFLAGLLSWGGADLPLYGGDDLQQSVASEVALLRDTGARLVVTGFTLSAYLSARVAGIPLATSHGGSYVRPVLRAGLAPVPVNSPKPELAKLPVPMQRWLANLIPRLLRRQAREINAVAAELGVAPVRGLLGLMSGDLTLVPDLPQVVGLPPARLRDPRPIFGGRQRRSTYRYTGPLFATLDRPIPARVQAFLDEHLGVVYLSPTSVDESLLRRLVESLKACGAPLLISATVHDIADLEDDRTMVADLLPNHLVLPQVRAAVIMGGQGSVQSALAAGVPFVGLPYHGEQELNVAIAERVGAALRISPAAAGTVELTKAVSRVLDEPSFTEAARRVQAQYAGLDGAGAAADAIRDFLAERQPGTGGTAGVQHFERTSTVTRP